MTTTKVLLEPTVALHILIGELRGLARDPNHPYPERGVAAVAADAASVISALAASGEDVKNAAMYRWIRERVFKEGGDLCVSLPGGYDACGMDLDAALLAAMAEKGEGNG